MPLTNAWSNIVPSDPSPANLIGADIRQLRQDLEERMDSVFCDSTGLWSNSGPANPVVPSAVISGTVVPAASAPGKYIMIPPQAFVGQPPAGGIIFFDVTAENYWSYTGVVGSGPHAFQTAWAPIILSPGNGGLGGASFTGVTLLTFNADIDIQVAGDVATISLVSMVYGSVGVPTIIATKNSTGVVGVQNVACAAFSHTINAGEMIFVRIRVPGNPATGVYGRCYGCQIGYTTPDCRSTL